MKVVAKFGERNVGLVERTDPVAKDDIVVVKVHVAPMCTEYKMYEGEGENDCLGHEAAGEVVEVAQPGQVKVGDRVAVMPLAGCGKCALCLSGDYIHCQHAPNVPEVIGTGTGSATYAQLLAKQDWLLVPIPDDISYEHGSMACCGLGPTFGAMQRMDVRAFDTVLITGLGPVGLGGVINARYRGARVIGVESQPFRARLAHELGAEAVFDPRDEKIVERIMKLTDGRGVDKAVDCSGAAAAHRLMLDATRRRGDVAFVGEGGDLTVRVSTDFIRSGITAHGSWHFKRTEAHQLMQVIRAAPEQLDKLITHRFPLDKVKEAWELQLTGDCGKVMLLPQE